MIRFQYRQARQHRTGSFRSRQPLACAIPFRGERRASQVPGKPLCGHALLSDPGDPPRQAIQRGRVAFHFQKSVGDRDHDYFGAQSHGLSTRYLRFTAAIARSCARLATGWWLTLTGWDFHPLGFTTPFSPPLAGVLGDQASPGAL